MKYPIIVASILLLYCTTQSQQIRFSIYGHDPGFYVDTIDFGTDLRATFCEDTALGEHNNNGPPPFPFAFMWVNPRVGSLCDYTGCFDCGRIRHGKQRSLDLRPFISPTQVDTFCVFIESYESGYPFLLGWMGPIAQACDSMKLMYTGSTVGTVVVNMSDTTSHSITDPSVSFCYIIMWGVKEFSKSKPLLSLPANNSKGKTLTDTLVWQSLTGANRYICQIATDSLFTSPLHSDTTTGLTLHIGSLNYHTTYCWRVEGLDTEEPSSWSDVWRFTTISQLFTYPVSSPWNIISLPLTVDDAHFSVLFPTAISKAISYGPGGNYTEQSTLTPGVGYWVRFRSSQSVAIRGVPMDNDTIMLVPGWNMIGSIADTIAVDAVESVPPSNLASFFYGYTGGYAIASTLMPMQGYWVKALDSGIIVLSAAGRQRAAKSSSISSTSFLEKCNSITVEDASGNSQILYFGEKPDGLSPSFSFEMPPVPTADIFDVRFATGQSVEFVEPGKEKDIPIIARSDAFPLTLSWNIPFHSNGSALRIGNKDTRLITNGSIMVAEPGNKISLLLRSSKSGMIPMNFSLSQNYPNPFNPNTTIDYQLPVRSKISLRIINMLGQVVRELKNDVEEAGTRQVEWDAVNFSSGIYVVRLDATGVEDPGKTFSQERKMLLIK